MICRHDAPYQKYFEGGKYQSRIAFLALLEPAGLGRIRNHARRLWAVEQVLKDMNKDDAQYDKADLFLSLRSVYARLWYPLGDPSTGDSKLVETTPLDNYNEA